MIVLGYFLLAVAQLLDAVLWFVIFLMFARAILSWVSPDPYNPIVQFINSSTEPILEPVRRRIPPLGMFDVSLMIVILVLYFLQTFLVGVLGTYASQMLRATVSP